MDKHLKVSKLRSEIKSQFEKEVANQVYLEEFEIQMEVNIQRQIMKRAE